MNKGANIFRIAKYQIVQLIRNPRLYMIVICNFVFLSTLMVAFRNFLEMYELKATPFLFVFLFTHASVLFSFMSGIVILFSDAPFFSKAQMFLIVRTGKVVWALGQMLYLVVGSFLYFLLLYFMSVMFLFPHISLANEWGSVWNTLARTDLGIRNGVNLVVSTEVLNQFNPIYALGWTVFMGILNSILIGLILFACNIFFCRETGIILAVLLILAPYRLSYMPTFMHYVVTTAWLDPSYLFFDPLYRGPDAKMQTIILVIGIIILINVCILGISYKDLPEVEV